MRSIMACMALLLADLADFLRKNTKLKIIEVPGWREAGRGPEHGGFDPVGVLWHHTGSVDQIPNSVDDDYKYAVWLSKIGRSDLPPPLCHVSVGRDGTCYMIAAGRSNHAGKARPSGPIPGGDGNELYIGIECQNSGSEGWSKAQHQAMITLAAALSRYLKRGARIHRGHKETSVTGKWDPGRYDMSRFRADIAHVLEATPAPKPVTDVLLMRQQIISALQEHGAKVPATRIAAHRMITEIQAALDKGPKL